MRTILYIVNQLRKAGPVVVLHDIIRYLNRSEFRPVIVKLMEDDPGPFDHPAVCGNGSRGLRARLFVCRTGTESGESGAES